MTVNEPLASVITPAYNAGSIISLHLKARAERNCAPPFEVVVVANCCANDMVENAKPFEFKLDLRIMVADERASSGYERNTGA